MAAIISSMLATGDDKADVNCLSTGILRYAEMSGMGCPGQHCPWRYRTWIDRPLFRTGDDQVEATMGERYDLLH